MKSEGATTEASDFEKDTAEAPSELTSMEQPIPTPQLDETPATPPAQILQSTVPPPAHQGYVYQRNLSHLQPPWRDPNVLDVVNPRRWGAGQAAVSQAALISNRQVGGENVDQVWGADDTLADWRQQVSQQSHPDSSTSEEPTAVSEEVDDVPDRPNSVPPILPAVTAYISSESSATSKASTPKPSGDIDGLATPPLVPDTPSPQVDDELPTPTGPSRRRPSISHVELDGQVVASPPRTPRPPRRFGPGSSGTWWKREPHPAYSAEYSARRLLAT